MIVNIVGKAEGWQSAPNEGEVWGVNDIIFHRWVSRVIDIHDPLKYPDLSSRTDKTRSKAKELNIPVIDSENYPFKEIIEYFGTDFFTNTIDYMIALAIYEGATEINMYGVVMKQDSEYAQQRASLHLWIGQAMGRGIKVRIMTECSTMLRTSDGLMYGWKIPQKIDRSK